ncbi:PREDICTED: insulin-degrading enzyme isoform X2 [Vollenhovia emeryi]|uniref:insulin-degrading enzyme isoform X2 n=1 Tax=Vollenhovia emeryi TaxID=411798 RepID=UPI0005F3F28E|nr:PREDICTED: insulin-degrading enzyme isoform X2 [Vollenhovia emeryi]
MTSFCQNDGNPLAESCDCKNNISEPVTLASNMSTHRSSSHKRVEERYDDIIKSQNDDRLYRGLVLANKMKVLLISDSTTDKSAVAMDVNIGYMCDPDDLPGLAHFCEHMLFLGTEKYPQQNDYTMYLSQNGGGSNAATYSDHTTYYFDITPEKLEGGLDRFSQFFKAPLFTEALTELELNAINSEHEKNVANDTWRCDQVDKSSASPDHPFSKFGTGNRETLDTIPKQQGINVRNRLLEFHEKYYSANVMSLCILGKESLDELENMVLDLFSEIKNKEINVPIWPEHPFKDEHFRTIWYIVPIKDTRNLDITFPLPDMQKHYRSSPANYVSHLLGHEGEGSLLSALKARSWCNSLVSWKRPSSRGFEFFSVVVDLTEEGIKHIEDIVQLMFQYINMLKRKDPIKWIYDEYKDIANINFRFKEKFPPRCYVTCIVQMLQEYPMNDVLCAQTVFPEWRPDLIEEIMKYLVPENIRIHVVAKAYENIADETEKWYGTKYKKVKISKETMDMWKHAGYNNDLRLPSKNEFIASTFDIKPHTTVEKFPIILEDTSLVRLWYKKDDEFIVPRAKMIFDFVSPYAYMDPLSCNLTNMFVQLFRDSLNEYAYDAELAGLQWELNNSKYGIALGISGYDDKQRVFLEKIMDRMINFKIDPKRFEILKENYIRNLKNFAAEQPYQHAMYYIAVLLTEQAWLKDELLDHTPYLSVDRLQYFIRRLLSKLHVECLIHGNVTVTEATDILKLIESKLTTGIPHIESLVQKQLVLYREIKLDHGCHFLFEAENKWHKSSCTTVYHPTGLQSTETNMLLELLAQIIAEPCFNILRTKEQLGYIVLSGIRRASGTQGLRIVVQSDKHPQYVEKRIDSFLDSMLEHISTMPEEQFEEHKKALATIRLEKPKMLSSRSTLYWNEIVSQQYNFDRVNIEVAYLKTITQEQLFNFYEENVHNKGRRKLSVHVISTTTDNNLLDDTSRKIADLSIDEDVKKINDIVSFKKSQHLYPLLKPYEKYFLTKGIRSSKL